MCEVIEQRSSSCRALIDLTGFEVPITRLRFADLASRPDMIVFWSILVVSFVIMYIMIFEIPGYHDKVATVAKPNSYLASDQ